MSDQNKSRRKFIKAAAYTAPVVMTLKAAPSFACGGSPCQHKRKDYKEDYNAYKERMKKKAVGKKKAAVRKKKAAVKKKRTT